MTIKVQTNRAPAAIGPYSQAIRCGEMVFCSGQLPVDPETGNVPETIDRQVEMCLKNLEAVLAAAGGHLTRVVKTTVFLRDMADFPRMNKIYACYFGDACAARSTVEVARLPKDALIEIDAIAVLNAI